MSDLKVPDLNMVMIAGRLTRDPELKYTAGNRAYARFGIANTRYFKSKEGDKREETVFASVSIWDKQAEWLGERIKKGRPVLVEGSLNSYEVTQNPASGIADHAVTYQRLEIRARRVTPLDWDEQVGNTLPPNTGQPGQDAPIPEDDMPF